jgi:hypothetical protein
MLDAFHVDHLSVWPTWQVRSWTNRPHLTVLSDNGYADLPKEVLT